MLLTTEGTYPHYTGGVSTWCDFLIRELGDVDFVVWTLMMNPFIKQQYDFPSNVVNYVGVPLWGVEQPAEYTREIPSGKVFETSRRTRDADIERHFIPLFQRFLEQMSTAVFSPEAFATVLADMHVYFRDWEYRTTWRSRVVWDAFKQHLLNPAGVTLPAREQQDLEEEGYLPRWDGMRDSFGFLVRGDTRDQDLDQQVTGEVPTLGEAMEGLRWLYRLLQTLNVDVPESDVTHSAAAAFCAIPCILKKVERGTPFLLTEHGVYLREQYLNIERRRFPYSLKRFLIDLVSAVAQTSYHLADQISPVCRFNSRWELNFGATEDRIRVIYNGVSPQTYRPMDVKRPGAPTVVQVGRIDPLKDQLTFLRVADAVRREIPDVLFLHYGPVSDDDYWEDVKELHAELRLQNTVKFMGSTDRVSEVINAGDITLLTSVSEAFPYAVVESLMCGVPVVSTGVGGVREALDGTGAVAATKDVEGLAAAVIEFLNLPPDVKAAMSHNARERALEHFTLQQFVDAYRDSYHDLATRSIPTAVPHEDLQTAALEPAETGGAISAGEPPYGEPAEEPSEAPLSLPELMEALRDPDPFVRVRAIARARRERGVETVLEDTLSDAYPQVRREALRALVRIDGARAAHAVSAVASSDPSAEVRAEAVAALAALLGSEGYEAGAGA